jgi:glycosyl transferase family 2
VILSVSTVKDAPGNVEKWVRRNLAGGIDHLVVCLDSPQPEVEDLLDAHPDVTAVRAHGDWFAGEPAEDLNERQVINAGLVSRLVAGMPWAEWLFHVDGDEVVQIDRDRLTALEPEVRAVRLRPVEAVSRWHTDGDPTLFKRLPTDDELAELVRLGVLTRPNRRLYFRGHVTGKPGVRPSLDLGIGLHKVLDRDGRPACGCCTTSRPTARSSCASGPPCSAQERRSSIAARGAGSARHWPRCWPRRPTSLRGRPRCGASTTSGRPTTSRR